MTGFEEDIPKENRGGVRENAGRKRMYKNPAPISFTLEKEDKEAIKKKYKSKILKKYFDEWVDFLLDR